MKKTDVKLFENMIFIDKKYENTIFNNCDFYYTKFYDCTFKNVEFVNCQFTKLDFKYCVVDSCKYDKTKLFRIDSYQTIYKNTIFSNCDLFDCFGNARIKNITFNNMDLAKFITFETIIDNLTFNDCINFDLNKICKSINIGTFEDEIIISGQDAKLYLLDKKEINLRKTFT